MAVHFLGGVSAEVAAGPSLVLWPHAVRSNRVLIERHGPGSLAYRALSEAHALCVQTVARAALKDLGIDFRAREFVQIFPLSPVLPADLVQASRDAVRLCAQGVRQYENHMDLWRACERASVAG